MIIFTAHEVICVIWSLLLCSWIGFVNTLYGSHELQHGRRWFGFLALVVALELVGALEVCHYILCDWA